MCVLAGGNGDNDGTEGVSFSGWINMLFLFVRVWSKFEVTLGPSLGFFFHGPELAWRVPEAVTKKKKSKDSVMRGRWVVLRPASPRSADLITPILLCWAAQITDSFTFVLPISYCNDFRHTLLHRRGWRVGVDRGQHILIPIISVWLGGVIGIIGLGRPCGLNEFPFSSPLLPWSALISLMSG